MSEKNTIKGKIVAGFLLAIVAMLLTGIISYTSYKELLSSLNDTHHPEVKLKKLSEILADISEAEASMRAYTLTRDDAFLSSYRDFVSTTRQDFEHIKTLDPVDAHFNQRIDSIDRLLDEKIADLNAFISLKQTISEVNFSLKALEEINSSTDSLPTLRTTKTTTTTTTTLENLPKREGQPAEPVEESNKKRKRKRVQELAKQIAKLELEPKIQTETKITTDTSTSFIQSDTVLGNINRILEETSAEESRYQKVLAKKELELIEGNIAIIDRIRRLINNLEREELSLSIARANRAKIIASRSTLTISIIIILCLISGLGLVYYIFKDISFRNFYHRQLLGAKNQAEQLAESKQKFLANMSHEIRTPLNAIIGFTEQLSHTDLVGDQKQYLNAVQTSSQHLLNTVNDILDYSKIEAGEVSLQHIPFDLHQTITEVVDALQVKAHQKNIGLELDFHAQDTTFLQGDPFRLKQVLFNLVSNGIKFTHKGSVKVSCRFQQGPQTPVTIQVSDSGIGMKPELIRDIFNDFKQADDSATRKYEGTGLGLAISKRLVELQGGTIEVKSKENKGSEFTVCIDYTMSEELPAAKAEQVPDRASFSNARLLVVDDDSFNLRLLEVILKKWGLQADVCQSGREALDRLDEGVYHLILTDIHMPDVSGLDLCRQVRSRQDTPIIALTANVMEHDIASYLEQGINKVLLKPYTEDQLYHILSQYLVLDGSTVPEVKATEEFSLDDFIKFSGGDEKALLSILQSFKENLSLNMKELQSLEKTRNYQALADLAHKMISSFGHLHAVPIVSRLRAVENTARNGHNKSQLGEIIVEVVRLSQPVLTGLEKEIAVLSSKNIPAV